MEVDVKDEKLRFETLAVHAGVEPDPSTGAIMTPIFATSTYVQSSPGVYKGYDYSRTKNPTRSALETSFAALEGGSHGFAMASGCAASDALLHLLEAGDHVVSVDDVYGGTSRLFRTVWARHGVTTTFGDLTAEPLEKFVTPKTKMIWIETPTNPLLKVIDIEKVAKAAAQLKTKPLIVVDNTFATPFCQSPFKWGADIVLHSTTKYINGHSDCVGGAIMVNDEALAKRIHHIQNSVGAIQGAFESWLVLRGIKTLAVRMNRHDENGRALAKFLETHPKVERVIYPGLESHPQYATAKKQMRAFGGMLTFFLKGEIAEARKFLENLKVFTLAESLGGVESLVDHPAIMTHASLPPETRKTLGITDNLIRLSIGIENVEDLKADLDQALKK